MSEPLPKGWVETSLQSIIDKIVGGGTPNKSNTSYFSGKTPFVTVKDFKTIRPDDSLDHITEEALSDSASSLIPSDTILITTRMSIAKIARFKKNVAINQDVKALFFNESIDKDYIENFLIAHADLLASKGTGTTVKGIRLEDIRELKLFLPPLAEQKRIVAKLEALLARSTNARNELARIPRLIERYKQAVLAAAFRGDLTADWRDLHKSSKVQGDTSGLDGRVSELEELPDSWAWTSLNRVCSISGGLTKNPSRSAFPQKAAYLRVANVYANELRLDDIAEIGIQDAEWQRVRLQNGDLLIVEGNGSLDQIGRVALWNDEIVPCAHQNHIIKARPLANLLPKYGLFWLLSPSGRKSIEIVASSSAGLHTLSLSKVSALPIPVCSVDEMTIIVERTEAALKVVDSIAAELTKAEALRTRLEQATLAKAFRGELVPQNPNDEPASVLLERIRSEREAQPKAKRIQRVKPVQETISMQDEVTVMVERANLLDVIKDAGKPVTPEELLRGSIYTEESIEDFYAALKLAVESKQIAEDRDGEKILLRSTS